MKKNILVFISMLFVSQMAISQNIELSPTVISSAGNYSESETISLSWTLGELAVSTLSQGDIILSQGFQQSFLSDVGFNLDPIKWQIIAYPNPVDNELRIQFDLQEPTSFIVEMQDVTGRLLSQDQFKEVFPGDVMPMDMTGYNPGVYFLRISNTNREQARVLTIRKN